MREETFVANLLTHKRTIEAMLGAMAGLPGAVDDLFQEVALVMTRRREEATEDCRFVAWARSIALNVVRDWRKKASRARVRFIDDAALEAVSRVFEDVESPLWEQRRRALEACAEELPDKERNVLRRRYREAEDVESIAASLQATRGAVDTLLYRIRRGLHACVEGRLRASGAP